MEEPINDVLKEVVKVNAAEKKDQIEFYPAKRTDVAPVRLGRPLDLGVALLLDWN